MHFPPVVLRLRLGLERLLSHVGSMEEPKAYLKNPKNRLRRFGMCQDICWVLLQAVQHP